MQAGIEDIIVFISTHHQHNNCQQQLLVLAKSLKSLSTNVLLVKYFEFRIDQKRHSNERSDTFWELFAAR